LRAPLGVYGVLGNHDLALLEVNVAPVMKAAGIHELYDSGVWLRRGGDRLRLAGLSGVLDSTLPPPAVGHATPEDFVLLASHSPDVTESLGGTPVDLVLAGHTHGGQITVFGLWSPLIPSRYGNKYRVGMVTSGPVPVYVTTGVGTIVVPLRFFARPEVVLLTLRRT
jgi:predicted MPP superfamily phosphohydrolase